MLLGAGAALVLLAALMMVLKGHHQGGRSSELNTPRATSSVPLAQRHKSHHKQKGGAAKKSAAAQAAASAANGLPGSTRKWSSMPGLPGGSLYASLPKMHITLSVRSAAPIGILGYVIPTSQDHPSGKVTGVGRSWSLQTIGYGRPDYARIFLQANTIGTPITCTITVNGRVTEHSSTEGPYGRMMCQG